MKTRIVATVGPSTRDTEVLQSLISRGVNVVRINFAHGTHKLHAETIGNVREIARKLGRPVAILGDLAGPKIRTGNLKQSVPLIDGQRVRLFAGECDEAYAIPSTYTGLARDVHVGARILLDDGLLELEVRAIEGDLLECTVITGGLLQANKGINLPGIRVQTEAISEKDREDVRFAVEHGLDYLGLSFAQTAEDVHLLRSLIPANILIVVKLEKDTALENLEPILLSTDAVMVARGDLGVELPFEQVPLAQKRIIHEANLHGKPVITATQMMASMVSAPRPTRAEVSDVANAILDGTDAVMLSNETASGDFPLHAVEAMARIIQEVEVPRGYTEGAWHTRRVDAEGRRGATPTEHAIASATVAAAKRVDAKAIVALTRSGATARLISSYRPEALVLGVCTNAQTYQQLALVWGVEAVLSEAEVDYEPLWECARNYLKDRGIVLEGDRVVVSAGFPFQRQGGTNMLRVETV